MRFFNHAFDEGIALNTKFWTNLELGVINLLKLPVVLIGLVAILFRTLFARRSK